MFRLIVPVIICIAGPLSAQTKFECDPGDPGQSCQQLLACIGTDGRWFSGEVRGAGPVNNITGTIDNGVDCTGQRMQFNKFLTGEISLDCTDGTQATLDYALPRQSTANDYAYGRSTTQDGRPIQVWLGNDLVAVLRRESGGIVSLLPCPGGAVRLD